MSTIGWGSAPWGLGLWGGGPGGGSLQISDVTTPAENVIRVEFTESVFFTGVFDAYDAARPALYDVVNFAPSIGLDGLNARPVSIVSVSQPVGAAIASYDIPRFLDINLDRAMSPYPSVYQFRIVGDVYKEDKSDSLTGVQFGFYGTYREIQKPTLDAPHGSRDLANPQAGSTEQGVVFDLGTYLVSDDGDLQFDEGMVNLKKRVFRRMMTKENGFAHLPGYGIGIVTFGKKLAQNSVISGLVSKAETQLRSEPEIESSRVIADLTNIAAGLLRMSITVRTKDGVDAKWGFSLRIDG